MADVNYVMRVLAGVSMLPLEDATDHAAEWRADIAQAIKELDTTPRLPDNDPLRFNERGERLSREELDAKLESIIESWPSWEQETKRYGRSKAYPVYRPQTFKARRG
tara:strand:- start:2009 stop:2329 length:321 start_codon:yes stop_codon:yes gene_type:complete